MNPAKQCSKQDYLKLCYLNLCAGVFKTSIGLKVIFCPFPVKAELQFFTFSKNAQRPLMSGRLVNFEEIQILYYGILIVDQISNSYIVLIQCYNQ